MQNFGAPAPKSLQSKMQNEGGQQRKMKARIMVMNSFAVHLCVQSQHAKADCKQKYK